MKYIRHDQPGVRINRGSLYSVHFEPNEKGGYNESLTFISDVYETVSAGSYPPPLIFAAGVRRMNGHMRLSFGIDHRQSVLHLIDCSARERFFSELLRAICNHEEVRIEVAFGN